MIFLIPLFYIKVLTTFVLVKKYTVAILAFLYLTITSGVVVNWHYCMGDLSSVQIGATASDHCSKCGMKDKKGCCETEFKLFKVNDEHQWSKTDFHFESINAVSPQYSDIPRVTSSEISLIYESYHAPPPLQGNEIYLHIGVFRI